MGGWSPKSAQDGGVIDAGLQYNYEASQNPKKPSGDDSSLFLKIPGFSKLLVTASTKGIGLPPQPEHIDCGTTVLLEFHVAPWELAFKQLTCPKAGTNTQDAHEFQGCGTYALMLLEGYDGGTLNGYGLRCIVWIAPDITYGGWAEFATSEIGVQHKATAYWPQVPCGGCIFKWMTSIAQETESLQDGSHFSASWSQRGIAPWAYGKTTWTDPQPPISMNSALTRCSEYPLWTTYSSKTVEADCENTPKSIKGIAASVQASGYSVTGEKDTITLAKP